MDRYLGGMSDYAYAFVRIVIGFFMACHGAQKLFGFFGGLDGAGHGVPVGQLMWFVGWIEFLGGALVFIGLFASWAAFLVSGLMAFAYFMVHQPQALFPIQNKGELAAVYSFAFLLIATRGSGPLSVDEARGATARRY